MIGRRTLLGAGALLAASGGRARADDTLKVGVVLPLTGPAAESGQFKRNGIQLAA
ncbi:MAG: hypothetical protein JOZ42_07055 [Acetobacteraceae bacterium]|nr:hypothetical protein [Acetobacteraceae bacterium]